MRDTSDEVGGLEQSFIAALRAAENAPDSDDAWDHLEELADELQRPDEIGLLYREVLERKLPRDVMTRLAERAVRFHEEWFGDNPSATTSLLARIIERDPDALWAFERATMVLTHGEQWSELLSLYDRTLSGTRDPERKRRLLDDAAHVAKDFADQHERAADYMNELLRLEPGNAQLSASVERLYERQERWENLIELWRGRIAVQSASEARSTKVRIAVCFLDRLADPRRAATELQAVVDENPGHVEACRQLERILELETAPAETRRLALSLLRKNYEVAEQPHDVVRVLERALQLADANERAALHREAGTRLAILARDNEAIEHYASLLRLDPTDSDARKQIRHLARRSNRHDLHASALVSAADACTDGAQQVALLLDAAHLYREGLGDADGAIDLYRRVLSSSEAETSVALAAAHNLNELLAAGNRSEERLAVLERLAELERAGAVRRFVLGEAARLAESIGEVDRALAAWRPRLEADAQDLEALSAVVDLLEKSKRWAELVDALNQRAAAPVLPQQRRADLVRIGLVQELELDDADAAIKTWLQIRKDFGDEADTIDALDRLMAAESRYAELADIIDGSTEFARKRAADRLARLGDLAREHLAHRARATVAYAHALSVDPAHDVAQNGLRALLDDDARVAEASEALAEAFTHTDDWQGLLSIVEARLRGQEDPVAKARTLREAADACERRADDADAARRYLSRALPFDPVDVALEDQLVRLARTTGVWDDVARAFGEAASAITDAPARAAQLRIRQGRICERELQDLSSAVDAYRAAAEYANHDAELQESIARCAAHAARWDVAARAAIGCMLLRDRMERGVVEILEQQAERASAWAELALQWSTTLASKDGLRPALARDLEYTVAKWFHARCADSERAEAAVRRALEHMPDDVESLQMLAALQRRNAGPDLVDTLLRLDSLARGSLDPGYEAATVALGIPGAQALARDVLDRLYRDAAGMWMRGEEGRGEQKPPTVAAWSLDRLVLLAIDADELDRAVRLLVDGARLPFHATKSRELRRRAAELLAEQGERGRAIDLYRGVLEESPDDLGILRRIAGLCEQEQRVSELLAMRLRELSLTSDPARKLELRLEISGLTGVLESQGGRVESLEANLTQEPGHPPSIAELEAVLSNRGMHLELADTLSEQARVLQARQVGERAAELWAKVAEIAERQLHDLPRAIEALCRIVELVGSNEALDALARLNLELDDAGSAARWLEHRLTSASAKERVPIMLRLARAQIQAERMDAAVATLEAAFAEAPRNAEVRKLLIGLHRQREDWEALARTLATASEHVSDDRAVLAYAREAAELYHERMQTPERSVPVLRKALEIVPDDRRLKGMLAEGLRAADLLDEARELLTALIEDFGRRRSPERAAVHLQLARVARAQGNIDEAIDQLDTASKMDATNLPILRALAELARESGQLERAERAYRTLLLTVRRAQTEATPVQVMGASEILFELSRIGTDRGQQDQAAELFESALEALSQNDGEAPSFQSKLAQAGQPELLKRVLEARLGWVESNHRKAEVYVELADVLEHTLQQPEAALEARLKAVEADPGIPTQHQTTRELASRLGQLDRYVKVVETLLANARRDSDAHVRCELLLRLGEVMEKEHGEFARASELYQQAEQTGVRQVDVWRAAARVAGARGDEPEQMRLLAQLASLGEDEAETRADALYRMAEVQLASAETMTQGLDSLTKALADAPKLERAGLILRRAAEAFASNDRLLDLYEQVARKGSDPQLLLHYLECRANHPRATPEQAREAVELAFAQTQLDRAEALLLRAVEIGRGMLDGMARVDWALLGLAELRKVSNDLAGAVKWLSEAADVADTGHVFALSREVAELAAQPGGDLTLAAKLYERLLEREPTAREVWQPLAELYRRLGTVQQLERLVDEILDGLPNAKDRNALRVELARALLAQGTRASDAVSVLQDVLLEEPEDQDAQLLLAQYLEQTGNESELVDLLRNQVAAARARQDVAAIKVASLQLAKRLREDDPAEARAVCLAALEVATEDPDLLRTLCEQAEEQQDPAERTGLLERLLRVEDVKLAADLALDLAEKYRALSDDSGVMRVLEIGHQRVPEHPALRAQLEQEYRDRGDFAGLVRTLSSAAEHTKEPGAKVSLLREAATVQRDLLFDAGKAAQLLRRACEFNPEDMELRIELAAACASAGDPDAAAETLSSALDAARDDKSRLLLLRTRADMRMATGDFIGSCKDLEDAYVLDPANVAIDLEAVLHRVRTGAATAGDEELERKSTLRSSEIMLARGKREDAHELLTAWVEKSRKDIDALRRLRDLDTEDDNWEGVIKICGRLVAIEVDEDQVEAALRLSTACERVGRMDEARAGLEHARRKQPKERALRSELVKIYERTGARQELAKLLLEEAEELPEGEERVALLRRAGMTLVEIGDGESAVDALREVLRLSPKDPATIAALADALLLAGELGEADALLDRAIADCKGRRSPDLCLYHSRKAHIAKARGDAEAQLGFLQQAHISDKNNGDVAAELANLAEERGDLDLATKILRNIALMDAQCPISKTQAFLRQGKIAHKLGDRQRAVLWARRAKHEDPSEREVETFLQELGEG